jgi:hypothetical protein
MISNDKIEFVAFVRKVGNSYKVNIPANLRNLVIKDKQYMISIVKINNNAVE